jgi:transcriptional regulator with XRE-family HTH domain
MPNIDPAAKAWQKDVAGLLGRAVQARRRELGLSVAALSRRTSELGFGVSRAALAKIESNHREGKFDVVELTTLAAALRIAPLELLYPDTSGQKVEPLPGRPTTPLEARMTFAGDSIWSPEAAAALSAQLERINQVVATRTANLHGAGQLGSSETVGWTATIAGTEEL